MTDLERFVALYRDFGIDLTEIGKTKDGNFCITLGIREGPFDDEYPQTKQIGFDKFDGYAGLYSLVEFDKDGKFIKQGFWE